MVIKSHKQDVFLAMMHYLYTGEIPRKVCFEQTLRDQVRCVFRFSLVTCHSTDRIAEYTFAINQSKKRRLRLPRLLNQSGLPSGFGAQTEKNE